MAVELLQLQVSALQQCWDSSPFPSSGKIIKSLNYKSPRNLHLSSSPWDFPASQGAAGLWDSLPGIILEFLALEKQWDHFSSWLCLQFLVMMFPSSGHESRGFSKQGIFLGALKPNVINPS